MLVLAQEEARLLDHGFIGTEHLLLGLVHEEEGVAARALRSFGISLESAREKVQEAIGVAGTTASGSPAFTTRAKKVLELSLREALQLGHSYIGTEHLLLGLIRQGESMGVAVLESFGADPTSVRQQTISRMAGTDPDGSIRQIGVAPLVAATPEWTPPIWDRPSEGTVPAVLVVDAMVLQNDVVAVVVDRLEVYPNGFMINLLLRVDPRRVGDLMAMLGSRPRWVAAHRSAVCRRANGGGRGWLLAQFGKGRARCSDRTVYEHRESGRRTERVAGLGMGISIAT